jgi:hypothetical protein
VLLATSAGTGSDTPKKHLYPKHLRRDLVHLVM